MELDDKSINQAENVIQYHTFLTFEIASDNNPDYYFKVQGQMLCNKHDKKWVYHVHFHSSNPLVTCWL